MGGTSSKQQKKLDSSASYANGSKAPGVENDLPPQVMEEVAVVHTEPINSLCAVGEDQLLSGGVDKDVVLYCWTHHKTRARFKGPTKDVTKVDYNSKSGLVCAASRDRTIYGWKWPRETDEEDEEEGSDKKSSKTTPAVTEVISEADQTFNGHTLGVSALTSNEDYPQLLCSGSRDNSVGLWDVDTSKSVSFMYAPRNLVTGLEWIEGEKAVLQSSEDKTLRVWDMRTCSTVQHYRARNYMQTCCAVSDCRQQFLSGSSGTGSAGAELNLWDRRTEKRPLREFKGHTENVLDCMFLTHKEQQLVASVSKDSTVRLWDKDSGDSLLSEYIGVGPLTSIVSPSRGIIGCSSFDGGVILWTLMADLSDSSKDWTLALRSKY